MFTACGLMNQHIGSPGWTENKSNKNPFGGKIGKFSIHMTTPAMNNNEILWGTL
jgi:hypothetical protein